MVAGERPQHAGTLEEMVARVEAGPQGNRPKGRPKGRRSRPAGAILSLFLMAALLGGTKLLPMALDLSFCGPP